MPSNPDHHWLHGQLQDWQAEGLISAESAEALRLRHPLGEAAGINSPRQWLLGGLGVALVAIGILVILGHNWDHFSRATRLAMAFLPLGIAQWFCLRVLQDPQCPSARREGLALAQAVLAGSALAIVTQVYHIGGHWTTLLQAWMLLILPLAWALQSTAVSLLYLAGITFWALNQWSLSLPLQDSALRFPLLLLGLWPLRDALVRHWAGLSSLAIYSGMMAAVQSCAMRIELVKDDAFVWLAVLLASCFWLLPARRDGAREMSSQPHWLLGRAVLLVFGLGLTFADLARSNFKAAATLIELPVGWVLLAVNAGLMALAWRRGRIEALYLAALPWLALAMGLLNLRSYGSLVMVAYLAAHGLRLALSPDQLGEDRARQGALLLSALVATRLMESHWSALAKGLGFVAVGLAFLAYQRFLGRRLSRS